MAPKKPAGKESAPPLELSQPDDIAVGLRSRTVEARKLACRTGRAVLLPHNISAKLAVRSDSNKHRPNGNRSDARGSGSEKFVPCARRRVVGEFFLPSACNNRFVLLSSHRCSECFKQFRTPVQEDKVCKVLWKAFCIAFYRFIDTFCFYRI